MTTNEKLAAFLQKTGNAISNSLADEGILTRLSKFNYDATRLEEGKALYQETRDIYNKQMREYGEQQGAYQAFSEKKEEADRMYRHCITLARLAFEEDKAAQGVLVLNGARSKNLKNYFEDCDSFYSNLLDNASWVEKMSYFGFTNERIKEGYSLMKEVIELRRAYEREKGEAQSATRQRDEKVDELSSWMRHFYTVAALALEDRPQYLEKLGIVVH